MTQKWANQGMLGWPVLLSYMVRFSIFLQLGRWDAAVSLHLHHKEKGLSFLPVYPLLNKTTTPQFHIVVFIVNMAYRYVEEKIGGCIF